MEAFRTLIKGWLGKVLLAFFLVPFALVGIDGYFSGGNSANEVAHVGTQIVYKNQFDQAVSRQRDQLLTQVNNKAELIDDGILRELVLNQLVNQALLQDQAQHIGFALSDAQIAELIRKESSFQDNGQFSEKLFQDYLKRSGQDSKALINDIRRQYSLQLFAGGLQNTGFMSKSELDRILTLQSEQRHLHLASFPLANYMTKIQITDAQIAQYYNTHKAKFKTQESVDLEYLVLDTTPFLSKVDVTDGDLQARYQETLKATLGNTERQAQHILISVDDKTKDTDAKKKAEDLYARIQKGEDFATLAKTFSQDPGSAINGGDLGFAAKGTYVPEFESTLDTLKTNEISKPVKTQFGYHIIKLLAIRQPDAPKFEDLKPQLTQDVMKAKLDTVYADAINELNELAVDSNSLVDLAKVYNLNVQTAPSFTKAGGAGDLSHPDVIRTAFGDEAIIDQRISSGINIAPNRTIWLQSKAHKPIRDQNLAEAKLLVKAKMLQQEATKLAKQDADRVTAELNKGTAPTAVQAQFAVTFQDIGMMGRMTGLPDPSLQIAAFGLAKPATSQWTAITVEGKAADTVSVVAVSDVITGSVADVPAEQRTQLQKTLSDLTGQQELQDYVEYLKSKTKITKQSVKVEEDPS
jgi:peptidyl-prolyl cis-trans isomerase D